MNDTPVLTTERLAFHPFTEHDLPLLADLHGDREVMRYLSPDGEPWPESELRERLDRYVRGFAEDGFSKMKVLRREDGAFVGRAGFTLFEPTGEYELGYSFKRETWGQGYASEAAPALLRWLFDTQPQIDHVIGFAYLENAASRRVLEKIGMRPTGIAPVNGVDNAFYRIDRA